MCLRAMAGSCVLGPWPGVEEVDDGSSRCHKVGVLLWDPECPNCAPPQTQTWPLTDSTALPHTHRPTPALLQSTAQLFPHISFPYPILPHIPRSSSQFPGTWGQSPSMSGDHNWRLTVLLVAHAQDDLGGPVVACDHVGGHHEVGACRASQPKVQDLERAVRLYHNVAGFQVLGQENGW